MGKRAIERSHRSHKSQTLPPSPSHSFSSSSSSDFEFTISVSPRKSSNSLCPADELFYKGQLLPLHLSPRLSMVRTLLLASSSTSSSSDAATTASRDSTGSSNDSHSSFNSELVLLAESCENSARTSSVTEDEEFKRLATQSECQIKTKRNSSNNKYFSLARFSSVFKKESKDGADTAPSPLSSSSVKRMSTTAKEVIRKYVKKVKPFYEKISHKHQQQQQQQQQEHQKPGRLATAPALTTTTTNTLSIFSAKAERLVKCGGGAAAGRGRGGFSHSFSGNLRYPRRKSCISSCPSSIRSSPSHSGVLCRPGFSGGKGGSGGGGGIMYSGCGDSTTSSMEELQSAIQGAIAHCKNSLLSHNKALVINEI